jgi:hypothetical protein
MRGMEAPRSPHIDRLSWGRLEVRGEDRPYKDGRLFPGGSRGWDWRETGTSHSPGIQPADVEELLKHGVDVVVPSKAPAAALVSRKWALARRAAR